MSCHAFRLDGVRVTCEVCGYDSGEPGRKVDYSEPIRLPTSDEFAQATAEGWRPGMAKRAAITREQAKELYPETTREARKRKQRDFQRRLDNQIARRKLRGTTGITAEKSKR